MLNPLTPPSSFLQKNPGQRGTRLVEVAVCQKVVWTEEKMASVAAVTQQNVMLRVANLPLVSSACDMVSSAYISTKENHPYLKSACEVAEKGVKSITAVALTSTKPLIQKLESQIALANNYASISLDRIEAKLPILHQPADKIVANATDIVVSAKEAVAGTVMGAKDTVAHTVTGVMDKTKGAVQGSMEMAKAAVSGSMNMALGSRMVQMVSTGVDAALTKSEALVDQYLPLTEEEAAKEATKLEGFEAGSQKPNYYTRLRSLSCKVQRRASEQAKNRIKDAEHKSRAAIVQLYYTELHMQSPIIAVAQNLTRQLQTTCLTLVSRIQEQAHGVSTMAGNIYQNLHSATTFKDVSGMFLTTSKGQLEKMRGSLDEVIAYLGNSPLRWLGHFYPQLQQPDHENKRKEETAIKTEPEHSTR